MAFSRHHLQTVKNYEHMHTHRVSVFKFIIQTEKQPCIFKSRIFPKVVFKCDPQTCKVVI